MTTEWKPGDWAMGQIAKVAREHEDMCNDHVTFVGSDHLLHSFHQSALHPVPPPMTPQEQAVVDAADMAERMNAQCVNLSGTRGSGANYFTAIEILFSAVRAVRASRQPPDPVAEALRLLKRYRAETPLGHQPHMIAAEADAAIAAIEKART